MKSLIRVTSLAIIPIALIVIAISAAFSNYEYPEAGTGLYPVSDTLPDEVKEIINTSCLGCHAPGGRALAMAKLNFSEWDSYDAEKQMKKGNAICERVTKGSMPPKSYLKEHPEHALTAEQIEILCKWVENMNKVSAADQ